MKTQLIAVLASGVLAINIGAAFADEGKTAEGGLTPAVVEQMDVANKLIALGDARKDPILLIAAAKLQKSLSTEAAGSPAQSTATNDVLDRAKKLATGRKDLIGLADDVAAEKTKGGYIDAVSGQYRYTYTPR